MAEYKLGFYGEEIDLKLQQIEALHKSVTQLEKNDTDINAAITSINNAINELKNASSGAVKHIQRGVLSGISAKTTDISLSGFTNSDRMMVILNNTPQYMSDYSSSLMPYVAGITTNTLTIGVAGVTSNRGESYMTYQVIEFY